MPPRSYVPDIYQPNNTIAQMILEQGNQSAQNTANLYGSIGQGIGQLGQVVAGGLEEKKAKAAELKKQMMQQQQDQAFLTRVSDPERPLTASDAIGIYGPEKGMAIFKGYQSLQSPRPDLKTVMAGFDASSTELRAAAWPKARQHMISGGVPEESVPQDWDEEWYARFKQAASGEKPAAPFTLNPGEKRYGADGQVMAENAPMAKAPGTHVVGGNLVDDAGKVLFTAPREPKEAKEEPLVAIMGPDGEPVLVPRSQASGKRPASNREQGRPVTSGDAGRLAELDTSLDDVQKVRTALVSGTGAASKVGAMLPNVVTEMTGIGASSKATQATIDRVKQVIGKALEGGVLRKEDEAKYEKILPTIGDPPELVKSKLDGLEAALKLRKERTIESLSDSGYDTSRFIQRGKGGIAPGTVVDGYTYKGGDPNSESSWVK